MCTLVVVDCIRGIDIYVVCLGLSKYTVVETIKAEVRLEIFFSFTTFNLIIQNIVAAQ